MNNAINLAPFIVFIVSITVWALCFLCVGIYDHITYNAVINLEQEQDANTEALQDAIDSGMSEKLNEGEVT